MNANRISKLAYLLAVSTLLLVLSGCVRARMAIVVQPDGSGTLGVAVGMTQLAMSLAATDGESLMQVLSQEMSSQGRSSQDVTVRRWTEGEYEWIEVASSFADPNDLNSRLSETELFERFSLTRERGLFKDRFVLDAQLAPLLEEGERPEDLIIDPSGMFEFQISIHLPGDVTETNGVFASDSNTVLWTLNNYEPLEMHAVSEVWNWFNIGILAFIALGGILVVVGAGVVFYRMTRKEGSGLPAPSSPSTSQSLSTSTHRPMRTRPVSREGGSSGPVGSPDILTQINVRELLEQINRYVLGDTAVIAEAPDEIWMTWSVAPGGSRRREIRVKVLDRQTLMVNDVRVPATQEGVKQGLIAALKRMGGMP